MKRLTTLLLSLALTAPSAFAGIIAAVPSPKLDALTRGRATTAAPDTTIVAAPIVRKSSTRSAPAAATPTAPVPTSSPIAAPIETPAATNSTVEPKFSRIYLGAQLGDSIVGGLVGLQISKMYSVEVRYDYVDTVYIPNSNTKSSNIGLSGVALFPLKLSELKLSDMEPFYVFAKTGYERSTVKTTTTDPGLGTPGFSPTSNTSTIVKGRLLIGGGAQYDFTKFSGRVGVNFIGSDNSVYLSVLYKL
jgi:hypothetical protein